MENLNLSNNKTSLTAKELISHYKQSGLFDNIKNNILEKDISNLMNDKDEPINISKFIEKLVSNLVTTAVNNDNLLVADDTRHKQETVLNLENELSLTNGNDIQNILQKLIIDNTELQEKIQNELLDLYTSSLNI